MDEFPGAFEQLVLLALVRLGERAYGMTVRREIAAGTGRDVSLGAVYATLDRLQRKGWVSSRTASADDAAGRGGRARRLFRLEPTGDAVLRRALEAMDNMRVGAAPTRRGPRATPAPRLRAAGAEA